MTGRDDEEKDGARDVRDACHSLLTPYGGHAARLSGSLRSPFSFRTA